MKQPSQLRLKWRRSRSCYWPGFIGASLLLLASLPLAHGQGSTGPTGDLGVPIPRETKVAAVRGQSIDIELQTETKTPASLVQYVIRDFPSAGTIGILRPMPGKSSSALVRYTPDPSILASEDFFSFSVRYPGGIYSRPQKVTITLSDPAPALKVSDHVWFGHTMIGSESVKQMLVRNQGNAVFDQKVKPPLPYHMVSPADGLLRLEPNQEILIKLAYRPIEPGSTVAQFALQPNGDATALLNGQAFVPFNLHPDRLELAWDPETRKRSASLKVFSLARQALTVRIEPDKRLTIDRGKQLPLPTSGHQDIEIMLPPGDVEPFAGKLVFALGDYRHAVPIGAEAVPPVLELTLPNEGPALDFGKVTPGHTTHRDVLLTNVGGEATAIEFSLDGPFRLEDLSDRPPEIDSLPAGAKRLLRVHYTAPEDKSVAHTGTLAIRGDSQLIETEVRAYVTLPPITFSNRPEKDKAGLTKSLAQSQILSRPTPSFGISKATGERPAPNFSSDVDDERRTPLGFITNDLVERTISPNIPSTTTPSLEESGTHHLVLGWPLPNLDQRLFEIDMRQTRYDPKTHLIDSVWVPWHDVEYRITSDNQVRAHIHGLSPGMIFEFRVFSVTAEGSYSKASESIGFLTADPPSRSWIKWLFLTPLALFLSWFGYRYYRATYG